MRSVLYRISKRALVILCLGIITCAFLFSGCATSSDGTSPIDEISPAADLGEITSIEEVLYGESYAGYLVVFLKPQANDVAKSLVETTDPLDPPLEGIQITIPGLSDLEEIVAAHPGAVLRRSVSATPEQTTARRLYLETLSGKKLQDFNLVYYIDIGDPDEAVRLLRDLTAASIVEKAYPKLKMYVTSLSTVPDLTGEQGYLYPDETHGGLNAHAAWTAGAYGDGVILLDGENGWNFNHEDLPLVWPDDAWGVLTCHEIVGTTCIANLAHGTAVAGIIAAQDNGHGTTGFAPQVDLKTGGPGMYGAEILFDGIGDYAHKNELPPSSIFVIEVQFPGRLSDGSCDGFTSTDQYGCVPVSVDPVEFATIEYATAAGMLVIEGAGNGSISLDDPGAYYSHEITLYSRDPGSVLVGASEGSNHRKISFTNYGTPVDSYAWGQGVVTTAAPYGGSTGPYYWDIGTGPTPPNDDENAYFTNRFGGTSSAAAMVAGAAALVQSYAKDVMGPKRYLMPLKVREILATTGIAQSGTGGNIGKQPRIDRAIAAVDTLWSSMTSSYPELISGGRLSMPDMIALRAAGIGLICIDRDLINSDPACPEDGVYVPGTMIAKSLDFDGDGRADLVSWTNGQWKLDLSSVGAGGDNYGDWDVILNYPAISSRWVWPYVEDYNSDGRSDLAVYDKEHGTWYIAFTNSSLLGTSVWSGWDWEIDYSTEWVDTLDMDPWNSDYSRPAPGDYNNDGWVDIAIACSDGYWRIDHGGPNISSYGVFDLTVQYLTTARLAAAPGWAYLTTATPTPSTTGMMYMAYKVPDGLPDEGKMVITLPEDGISFNLFASVTTRFGGNDSIPILSRFDSNSYFDVGIKNTSSEWPLSFDSPGFHDIIVDIPPAEIYGGLDCRPVAADFDGDGIDDRAVMCPDEWKIAYSSDTYAKSGDGARHIDLTYDNSKFALPGRSYSGGISYTMVQQLIAYAKQANPTRPPPIPVDMVSTSLCTSLGGCE